MPVNAKKSFDICSPSSPSKTSRFGDISRRSLLAQYQASMVLARDKIGSPGRLRSSFINRSRINSLAAAEQQSSPVRVFTIEPQIDQENNIDRHG